MKRYKNNVGKYIGGCIYVHRTYAYDVLPKLTADKAIMSIIKGFILETKYNLNIVKYNTKANTITFLCSPDFDTAAEPYIEDGYLLDLNTSVVKYIKPKTNKQIYHHKWLFVKDDYAGFDVEEAKLRSKQIEEAMMKRRINRAKIGYQNYWKSLNI